MSDEKPYPIDTPQRMAMFIGDQLSEDLDAWEPLTPHDPILLIEKDGHQFVVEVKEFK